jgi:hypothetical protein
MFISNRINFEKAKTEGKECHNYEEYYKKSR